MRMSKNWIKRVRRKLLKPSSKPRTKTTTHRVLHTNSITSNTNLLDEQQVVDRVKVDNNTSTSAAIVVLNEGLSDDDIAAIKIQSSFRRHLARRAYRALRSLVKLQALVRGVCVRKQTQIAMHCMHALVRLQVRVRARQLLIQCTDQN